MQPELLFQSVNPMAVVGWVALAFHPLIPRLAQAIAFAIPLVLSLIYTALILSFWADSPGGFGSLADVMALMTTPHIALAGWLHYLAFDLFLGAWACRTAQAEGMAHGLVLPCLLLTFLFGPAGLLAFVALRFTLTRKVLP
jgi:hypothetical protein